MKFKMLKAVFLGLVLTVSGLANAAFITSTLYSEDDLTTVNGDREFLDVSTTVGMSISNAIANYTNDGFRLANYDDIIILFSAFGIDASGWNGTENFFRLTAASAQVELFSQTLGITTITPRNFSLGFFQYIGNQTSSEPFSYWCVGCRYTFLNDWRLDQIPAIGVTLVRDVEVPEPSTLAILVFGLVVLGARRLKK
nr:PEP-CTERM sorting domain-containing protein [uncultured Glaciecola sp.]